MTRIGIVGFVAAVALASAACSGSARSGKAAPGSSDGKTIATAAEAGGGSSPSGPAGSTGDATQASATDATQADGTKEIAGRVELIDRANNVTLSGTESVGHAFDRLKVDEDTEITVNGEQATLSEVHPGDEVRASFSGEGDELRVERIEVVSSGE